MKRIHTKHSMTLLMTMTTTLMIVASYFLRSVSVFLPISFVLSRVHNIILMYIKVGNHHRSLCSVHTHIVHVILKTVKTPLHTHTRNTFTPFLFIAHMWDVQTNKRIYSIRYIVRSWNSHTSERITATRAQAQVEKKYIHTITAAAGHYDNVHDLE